MEKVFLSKGEMVIYDGKQSIITKHVTLDTVLIEEILSGQSHHVKASSLTASVSLPADEIRNLASITEAQFREASRRFSIIKPILADRGNSDVMKTVSENYSVSIPSLYRWVNLFEKYNTIIALLGQEKNGGKGKSRLGQNQEDIINSIIEKRYLNSSRQSIKKTIREILMKCDQEGLVSPHPNTIRNRIKMISEEEKVKRRIGVKEAREGFEPHIGKFPGGDYPLAVVQIDHTRADIILVDEYNRLAYKRPWITLAIDVYSRMVVGMYISYEAPGSLGTGLCISHAILPKEKWLATAGIQTQWPCWGFMNTIHVDNAREFRGNMLKDACYTYDMNLEFRPLQKPNYGAHIERLMGTFAKAMHDLPGTTFSSVSERGNYDSEARATMTLKEFENWLTTYICDIYHKEVHSSLGMSPLERYELGIFGDLENPGTGSPARIQDELRLKLDFMPLLTRTVQEYGILIDHIYYYSDVLRQYIHSKTGRNKTVYKCRRDPRDISAIYFLDPDQKSYLKVPYRDLSLPPISVWEYRRICRKLNKAGRNVNQSAIFNAYRQLGKIEQNALSSTKKARKVINEAKESIHKEADARISNPESITQASADSKNFKPFDDIDDGPSY